MNDLDSIYLIITGYLSFCIITGSGMAIQFANRVRIELEVKRGLLTAKILRYFFSHEIKFASFLAVAELISLLLYVCGVVLLHIDLMQAEVFPFFPGWILLFMLFSLFLLILVPGGLFAEKIFLSAPAVILHLFAIPLLIFYSLSYPFISIYTKYLHFQRKHRDDLKDLNDSRLIDKVDINNMVLSSMELEKEPEEIDAEIRIFQNALEFQEIKLRECMVPRNEIIAIDEEDGLENLKTAFIETGLSRIIIFRNNIDQILGYVRSMELFKNPETISEVLTSITFVNEDMPAHKMLELFIREKKNMAIVTDEYGGTSGLITIEDIIEEIFGDIEDEHDTTDMHQEVLSNDEFIFSGRMEIDAINEKYQLQLPESHDYNTLNGFILQYYTDIPEEGIQLSIEGFEISILQTSETRIERVKLKRIKKNP